MKSGNFKTKANISSAGLLFFNEVSVVPKSTTHCPQQGQDNRPLNPDSFALTIRSSPLPDELFDADENINLPTTVKHFNLPSFSFSLFLFFYPIRECQGIQK